MHLETIDTEKPAAFADAVEASADADAARVDVLREEIHVLEVPMTDEEQRAAGVELADVHAVIAKLDADIEAEAANHKAAKRRLEDQRDEQLAQAKHLATNIRDKSTTKDVPVRIEAVFATSTIRTVRIDTGETIEERAMEPSERQRDLFPTSDAPESFSSLHDDESEPPQAITVEGEVLALTPGSDAYHFLMELRGFGTQVRVCKMGDANGTENEVGDHVELVGHYGGAAGDDVATFLASELRVIDPATEIDATKMATVGEAAEHKANGKRGRKS